MNKKVLAVAVSSALAVPMAAHAVKYKLSGQVNRAIVYGDDGEATDVQFIDNTSSGTRWRMNGSEDIGNGMKVGFNWEWQSATNNGGGDIKSAGGTRLDDMRKAEIWFGGNWGTVTLGKGSGAGDGTTESDLTSTWNSSAYVGMEDLGGNFSWRGPGGSFIGGAPGTVTFGDTYTHYDAFGRYDRLRYDSPALGPATLAASVGQNSRWEIAARVASAIAGGQLSGGLFYGETSQVERLGGSLSYLFSQGTSITGSYSTQDPGTGASDSTNWYAKVGHNWGNNSASIGYGMTEDATPGLETTGINVGFNHTLPKPQVDLYAGFKWAELDGTLGGAAVNAEDQMAFVVGTKLKFD